MRVIKFKKVFIFTNTLIIIGLSVSGYFIPVKSLLFKTAVYLGVILISALNISVLREIRVKSSRKGLYSAANLFFGLIIILAAVYILTGFELTIPFYFAYF
jgi:hypothetical protein